MRGTIPPLPQYACMAWCLVKAQAQLYLYLLHDYPSFLWASKCVFTYMAISQTGEINDYMPVHVNVCSNRFTFCEEILHVDIHYMVFVNFYGIKQTILMIH